MNSVKNIKYEILQLSKSFWPFILAVMIASSNLIGCSSGLFGGGDENKELGPADYGLAEGTNVQTSINDAKAYFDNNPSFFSDSTFNDKKTGSILRYKKQRELAESLLGTQNCSFTDDDKAIPSMDEGFLTTSIDAYIEKLNAKVAECKNKTVTIAEFIENPIEQNIKAVTEGVTEETKPQALKSIAAAIEELSKNTTVYTHWYKDTSGSRLINIATKIGENKEANNKSIDDIRKELKYSYTLKALYEDAAKSLGLKELVVATLAALFGASSKNPGLFGGNQGKTTPEDLNSTDNDYNKLLMGLSNGDQNTDSAYKDRLIKFADVSIDILDNHQTLIEGQPTYNEKIKNTALFTATKTKLEALKKALESTDLQTISAEAKKIIDNFVGNKFLQFLRGYEKGRKVTKKDLKEDKKNITKLYTMLRVFNIIQTGVDPNTAAPAAK